LKVISFKGRFQGKKDFIYKENDIPLRGCYILFKEKSIPFEEKSILFKEKYIPFEEKSIPFN